MKTKAISFLLTLLMSMACTYASAHDIEVANSDGVTIYYNWANNKTELSVSYRGNYNYSYSNETLVVWSFLRPSPTTEAPTP